LRAWDVTFYAVGGHFAALVSIKGKYNVRGIKDGPDSPESISYLTVVNGSVIKWQGKPFLEK